IAQGAQRLLPPNSDLTRKAKTFGIYSLVVMRVSMAVSSCNHLRISFETIAVPSLPVPAILPATGKLKLPSIHGIWSVAFMCSFLVAKKP
ncbi:MAG: hypothetical protein WA632_05195, partial [Gallionella sp.]